MTENAQSLIETSWRLPQAERIAVLGRAAELADASGDSDLGFRARQDLVSASYYVPGSINLIAAYSWIIARSDEDPERFPLDLWSYKWVVNALPALTSVSRPQIESVLDDLGRRFEAAGDGLAVHANLRLKVAQQMGETDTVRSAFDDWRTALETHRGRLNDCRACDEATLVEALVFLGEDRRAIDEAARLMSGRSGCTDQPHWTYPRLIAPARRLGENQLASDLRTRGYKLIRENRKFLARIGAFVRDSLEQGQLARAAELIAKHRSWLSAGDDLDHFDFTSAARVTTLRFDHIGRPLPDSLADLRTDGGSSRQVCDGFIADAEDLARRFDERNGNSWYGDILAADLAFAQRSSGRVTAPK